MVSGAHSFVNEHPDPCIICSEDHPLLTSLHCENFMFYGWFHLGTVFFSLLYIPVCHTNLSSLLLLCLVWLLKGLPISVWILETHTARVSVGILLIIKITLRTTYTLIVFSLWTTNLVYISLLTYVFTFSEWLCGFYCINLVHVFKMLLEMERGECESISILLLMHADAHNKVHWPSILQTLLLDSLVLSRWCYLWRKMGLLLFSPNIPSPFPSWSGRTSVECWLAMSPVSWSCSPRVFIFK